MDFKNGNWNLNDALDFDLEKASDLLDDKASNRIAENLRKHMGPDGFPRPTAMAPGAGLDYDSNQYKPSKYNFSIAFVLMIVVEQKESSYRGASPRSRGSTGTST